MNKYIKITSMILALVTVLSGVSLIGASAEETEYIQPEKFIYGDVDLDGKVSVKDATLVQKDLAKISYATAVQKYLADPEGIGYSVKNATAIQKYLAKYETTNPWGVELIMASQDEFSSKVSVDDNYFGNVISLRPISSIELAYEYTLADFPEYNFDKIEIWGSKEKGYIFYRLYLSDPSKENLINALKALDYRANIDLKSVQPDYYLVSA